MARHILFIFCVAFSTVTVAATTQQELLVHFDKDESILTPAAMAGLDAFIVSLPISGDYRFSVHGHTDSDGSLEYNEACNYSGTKEAIVLKAPKTFCPFLMQVSVTDLTTA